MRRMLCLLLGAALFGACNSDDSFDASVPTNMSLKAGDAQIADPGAQLAESLTVEVVNLKGDPVPGVTVEWHVLTGGGTLSAETSVTGPTGQAQVAYTLGALVGEQTAQAVSGSLSGSPVTFKATARSGTGGGGGGGGGGAAARLGGAIR